MAAKVHNRMPVILGLEHYSWWLELKFEPEFLKSLLRPFSAENMACMRVSSAVNDARNDGGDVLSEVDFGFHFAIHDDGFTIRANHVRASVQKH